MLSYILICAGMFCLGGALGCAVNAGDKVLAALCLVTAFTIGYIMRMVTAEQRREEGDELILRRQIRNANGDR